VYTTLGAPAGIAAFVPPEAPLRMRDALAPALRHGFRVGLRPVMQLLTLLRELEPRHPQGPHWHLLVLGVDPPQRGRGVPAALMAGVLALVDQQRLPLYLETMKPENLDYYPRFGFQETSHFRSLGAHGPEVWTMVRPARR
jgi:GNAT superfamily N-acetyltransferase